MFHISTLWNYIFNLLKPDFFFTLSGGAELERWFEMANRLWVMIKLYNILEINQNSIYCATLCNLNNIKEVIDKNG